MPRRVSSTRRHADRWAGLREIALAPMLFGPLPSPKRADLASLTPFERDRVIDEEAASDRALGRYLMWCLDLVDEMDPRPTTEEVERWTKRRQKAEKKARKAAKRRAAEAPAEVDPLDPVIPHRGPWTEPEEAPTSRVPLIPPPTAPARRLPAAYWDDDDD